MLGRARFEKISAVEGIKTTDESRRMFEEFDRLGLTPEERRAAILRKYDRSGKASAKAAISRVVDRRAKIILQCCKR